MEAFIHEEMEDEKNCLQVTAEGLPPTKEGCTSDFVNSHILSRPHSQNYTSSEEPNQLGHNSEFIKNPNPNLAKLNPPTLILVPGEGSAGSYELPTGREPEYGMLDPTAKSGEGPGEAPRGAKESHWGHKPIARIGVTTRGGAKTSTEDVDELPTSDKGGLALRPGEGGGSGDAGTNTHTSGEPPAPKGKMSNGGKFWRAPTRRRKNT